MVARLCIHTDRNQRGNKDENKFGGRCSSHLRAF
jgi:hypothetical protein